MGNGLNTNICVYENFKIFFLKKNESKDSCFSFFFFFFWPDLLVRSRELQSQALAFY